MGTADGKLTFSLFMATGRMLYASIAFLVRVPNQTEAMHRALLRVLEEVCKAAPPGGRFLAVDVGEGGLDKALWRLLLADTGLEDRWGQGVMADTLVALDGSGVVPLHQAVWFAFRVGSSWRLMAKAVIDTMGERWEAGVPLSLVREAPTGHLPKDARASLALRASASKAMAFPHLLARNTGKAKAELYCLHEVVGARGYRQFRHESVAALAAAYLFTARRTVRRDVQKHRGLAVDAVLFDASRVACKDPHDGGGGGSGGGGGGSQMQLSTS